ncbi:MAG: nuclear transport factor 2 family protein [Parvibaculum sp.]
MPVDQSERDRRSTLVRQHYVVENGNDMDGVMTTFSAKAVMQYNRQEFEGPDSIRFAHGLIGFGADDGALKNIYNHIDAEHFTDDEIIVEGRMTGTHIGEFQGVPASGRAVELPFVAFYRFDENDELVSERVVMNLGGLV